MATVRVDLDVTSKGEASLRSAATAMDGVGNAAKRADQALNTWTNTQQRAAQKMERMQEEAMKMNLGFSSTDDKAQIFSATLSKMSTTATQTAAALGMPIGQLGLLNSATEVAALGFGQLTKSAVGFNASSLIVVGAGAAIGVSIGTLAREQFPALQKAMDSWGESVARYFGADLGGATAGLDKWQKDMAAINDQVQQNVRNVLGSNDAYRKHYEAEKTWLEKNLDLLKKKEEAEKKAADAAKKAAEEASKNAKETAKDIDDAWKMQHDYMKQLDKDYLAAFKAGNDAKHKQALEDSAEEEKAAIARWEGEKAAWEDFMGNLERWHDENQQRDEEDKQHWEDLSKTFQGVSQILTSTGELFVALGGNADSFFGRMIDGFAGLADSASNVFANLASGNIMGAVAAGIGGAAHFIGSLLSGQKEHMKVNDMRDEFVAAAGGLDKLGAKAKEVGLTLDHLLRAKTVKDYESAVKELEDAWAAAGKAAQDALDLQNRATEKLNDAMKRYGITIDEMGPKFAQQELDKQALQLWGDYKMLTEAGADHNAVLEKMAPSMNEYVQTALKAGSTIPENLRPIIEQMISLGLLTDASGNAFASAEEAGINFGKTLEESMAAAADAIMLLVKELGRLYGLPPINIPVNVGGGTGAGAGSGGEPTEHPHGPNSGYAYGGISRGPASGHWELLHGTEAITPMSGGGGGWGIEPISGGGGGGGGGWGIEPISGGGGGGGATGGGHGGHAALEAVVTSAIAKARPVNVTSSPTIVVQDASMIKTKESEQAFGKYVVGEIDRALRLNAQGLASRVREVVKG